MDASLNISLREIRDEDFTSLAIHGNSVEIARWMRNVFPHPYTEEDAKKFIATIKMPSQNKIFAICNFDEVIGIAGIHPQDDVFSKNAEVGYWLSKSYWRQGVLSFVLPQVISYAFDNFDITRLFANVFEDNVASMKLLEKNNFQLEARLPKVVFKNEEFLDVYIYALRNQT